MEHLSDTVAIGPAAVPAWIVAVAASLVVTRFVVPLILQRLGLSDSRERAFDTLLTALLVAFVAWKLYPLVEIFSDVTSDPLLLLRAPGGRRGAIAGTTVAILFVAWRFIRVPDRNVLARATAITTATALILFLGAAAALGVGRDGFETAATVDNVPAFEMLDGSAIGPEALAGRPTVLTFWATWCAPCAAELPYKKRLYADYGDRVNFIGVNMTRSERSETAVAEYVAENEIAYPIALDYNGAIANRFFVRGTPTTVIINAEGTIVARWTGPVNADRIVPYLE